MLVAISGSQGSGKSTILQKLKELGYYTVERKTSRSILSDWGMSLAEINNDSELTVKFQDEITNRKFQDEMTARKSDQLYFTERTYADFFTYALVSLGKDNTYGEWLDKYYNTCMTYSQQFDLVYYLRAGHFDVEHDGTRGSNVYYSRMVDLTMLDFTQQMITNDKLSIIDTPDLEQRISIITSQVGHLVY